MPGRRPLLRLLTGLCGLLAFIGFIALGNWQLERRSWKLELIQQVDERVHAPATAAPGPDRWPAINKRNHEYRHVSIEGHFLPDSTTLIVAATELGSGYWVLTALQQADGSTVLVNRGFVGQGVEPPAPPTGTVQLSGLLRLGEPGGSVLRDNNPAAGRWYSRDVSAIALAHGLKAAPYFIDAAKGEPGSPGNQGPVGGLTVIQFHNNHLVYALTWYALAAMVAGAALIVRREQRRNDPQH